jgi:cyclopropane-fatty-acyl-phospholipid synthase
MKVLFRKLVLDSLKSHTRGALRLGLPSGEKKFFGGLSQEVVAEIAVKDQNFFRRCVLFGPIGFAESYIAGEWETPDLTAVISWFILNSDDSKVLKTRGGGHGAPLDLLNALNRFIHLRRPNSRRTSRKNIGDHYDLSNDFFKLWLDPSMTYSSAYFDPPTLSLEEAQAKKYDVLCRKLRLKPADTVLEIGSGWGGFSLHAAKNYGCRVTTVTISQQQFDEAAKRIVEAGLADRIDLRLCDYRDIEGSFDKIVSIEMLEAVGDRYVDAYFAKCDRLLKREGLLGLQAILCPDHQYPILRDGVDFIQKHIFPGSLLMCMSRITEALRKSGELGLLDYDDLGSYYARTLLLWREAFEAKRNEVLSLGFDEVFLRKWRYYLCYCEAAFALRHISVAQIVFARRGFAL